VAEGAYCAGCGDFFEHDDLCERCNRCLDNCCWHVEEEEPEEID